MEKYWVSISFTRFWSAFPVLLGEMTWRPFNLEQVFIGVERFPVTMFCVKSHAQKCNLNNDFKGISKKSENVKSATQKPYKPNAFPMFSGPLWASGSGNPP